MFVLEGSFHFTYGFVVILKYVHCSDTKGRQNGATPPPTDLIFDCRILIVNLVTDYSLFAFLPD